jgi:hypothetical protein
VNNQNGTVTLQSRNVAGVRMLIKKLTIRGINIPRIEIDKRISKELNVLLIKFFIMICMFKGPKKSPLLIKSI